ncbi:MAG: alpha/beta hydrolase [Thermoguttaceae bacterium]
MHLAASVLVAGFAWAPSLTAQEGKVPFYPDKSRLLVYLDADGQEHPVATPQHWQKRREHILANMQLVMGPLPEPSRKVPLDVQVVEAVDLARLVRKNITFAAEQGDRVPAYLLIPKGLSGRAPAMLCLHQTVAIGKDEPVGLGANPELRYALELAERGYVTLAPDYPGYGQYKFDPYAHGYASATMKGIWNHMRAVDLLESLPEVDPERIGVIGHSLGGHNAMFAAVFDQRIKAVVSSCGFNAFAKYYGGNLAGWSHKGYMPRIAAIYGNDPKQMPFDFTEVVAALAPRPFFTNSPLRDRNFEHSGVEDCLRAARPVYQLLGAQENLVAIHPDCEHRFPPEARHAAYEFLDKVLARRR